MIKNIILAIHSPSRYPAKASLIAGAFAALCMATAAWSTLIGVGFLVSALTFSVLSIRNRLYSGYTKMVNKDQGDAYNCGGSAGSKYMDYGKSFLDLPSWRHPIIFGQSMRRVMKSMDAIANNEVTPIKIVRTQKRFGFL
jgi:hypothetical protein